MKEFSEDALLPVYVTINIVRLSVFEKEVLSMSRQLASHDHSLNAQLGKDMSNEC